MMNYHVLSTETGRRVSKESRDKECHLPEKVVQLLLTGKRGESRDLSVVISASSSSRTIRTSTAAGWDMIDLVRLSAMGVRKPI